MVGPVQDEMKAFQRLNSFYFLLGYLGFVGTWIVDLIVLFIHKSSLQWWGNFTKTTLRIISPHFCLLRGIYQVSQTYR